MPKPSAGERAGDRERAAPERAPGRRAQQRAADSPTPPHATICHGVHGPCPKKKFEASAATAPTAKPGAPPSA